MNARILLADRNGLVRAEIDDGQLSQVVWRLNAAGSAILRIRRGSRAFKQELLEPGARIYVEFDNGLPAWGGILDLPRRWADGILEIRAYTIERLLKYVMTAKSLGFYGVPVGSIFTSVLREASRRAGLNITFGQVWNGGGAHWPRYHFRDVMWIINNSIRKMETCDYRFVPYLESNHVKFRAELHEQLGDDKRNTVALIETANIAETPELTEQGEIVNRVAVVGSGSTWGEKTVVYGTEEDSKRRYGLREAAIAPVDVSQETTLNRYADNTIRERAFPHVLATLSVINQPPARFKDYCVGDVVRVILPSAGFAGYDAPMRIVARGYDPLSGECKVVCSEYFEFTPALRGEDESQPGEGE